MSRTLLRRLLQSAVAICALGMVGLLLPLVLGSAEAFPTEEQEGKVRLVAGLLFIVLAAAGGGLLWVLRRMRP